MHPRARCWQLLDYVLVRRRDRHDVMVTKAIRDADGWTDHCLVTSQMRLRQRRPQERTTEAPDETVGQIYFYAKGRRQIARINDGLSTLIVTVKQASRRHRRRRRRRCGDVSGVRRARTPPGLMARSQVSSTPPLLHFRSNHPVGHKRSCVRTLLQRVQTHCSDNSGKKEETKYLHALFEANGYPKPFIRKCVRKPKHE
ncbi:unnamed protein product [Schistocephalus solidus]|uniref:Helix-turn-helix domain-containing protein n=1 Tax=Schistocephalus solidus TaxID=70667 RepID=A0A183SXU8_SCHSO|nr:unnamed protein product [Schistocephalus solidus]